MTYIAEIDEPAPDTLCKCGDCEWSGPFSALGEIEDCSLTPGDPSPAGRCPVCDTLAYIAAPSALALAARDLLRAMESRRTRKALEPWDRKLRAALLSEGVKL